MRCVERRNSTKGQMITSGLRDAIAHAEGGEARARVSRREVPNDVNVQAIRERLGLTQKEFAFRFGFSLGTLRHWEQGRRYPDGAARVLLKVIDHDHHVVEKALATG